MCRPCVVHVWPMHRCTRTASLMRTLRCHVRTNGAPVRLLTPMSHSYAHRIAACALNAPCVCSDACATNVHWVGHAYAWGPCMRICEGTFTGGTFIRASQGRMCDHAYLYALCAFRISCADAYMRARAVYICVGSALRRCTTPCAYVRHHMRTRTAASIVTPTPHRTAPRCRRYRWTHANARPSMPSYADVVLYAGMRVRRYARVDALRTIYVRAFRDCEPTSLQWCSRNVRVMRMITICAYICR
jgi:hypothetical protein